MIENIKILTAQVIDKKKLYKAVSESLGVSERTAQNYLVEPFYIPENHQGKIVEVLQKVLRNQIKKLEKDLGEIEVNEPIEVKE